jgi:transcriptional regulator with XRE-family HTH domain
MSKQQEVRNKLIKRLEREKQTYIAKQVGISKQVLSEFKLGKKELWDSTLNDLNDYLDRTRTFEEVQAEQAAGK